MGDNVRYRHAPQGPKAHRLLRAAIAAIESEKERRIHDIPRRDVGDKDVFNQGAVAGFERNSLRPFDHIAGDCNVSETSIRFRTTLDASLSRYPRIVRELLPCAGDHAA